MNVFHFVIWIVAIVSIASVLEKYMKLRARKKDDQTDSMSEETAARIDDLEERIQVLERIVTENKFDLRKQINDL